MTKPGYLTTEFWATVALNVGVVASSLAGAVPAKWAAVLSAVSVAAYAIARSLTKTGASVTIVHSDPAAPPAVEPSATVATPPA